MDRNELIDREARLGRIAGIVGIAGVFMTLLPPILGLGSDFNQLAQDEYALRLETFEQLRDDILLSQLIQAAGLLLFAAPLYFLFDAAANRNPELRRTLIGLTIIGPVFLAISLIVYFFAYDNVASTFVDNAPAGADLDEAAENALTEETTYSIFGGLQIAGLLSIVVAMIYTSLQAMRVGLLTRFIGTLGMALGAGFVFLGPISIAIWTLLIGMLIARWWFGPRPPAWEAGVAIPWPRPGEQPASEPEQLADPEEFEDSDGDGLADGPEPEKERPGRRDNKKKRKRKQR